ncbi:hypothetical protein KIPB_013106, partial [Kipferlia bialata]
PKHYGQKKKERLEALYNLYQNAKLTHSSTWPQCPFTEQFKNRLADIAQKPVLLLTAKQFVAHKELSNVLSLWETHAVGMFKVNKDLADFKLQVNPRLKADLITNGSERLHMYFVYQMQTTLLSEPTVHIHSFPAHQFSVECEGMSVKSKKPTSGHHHPDEQAEYYENNGKKYQVPWPIDLTDAFKRFMAQGTRAKALHVT